MYNMEHIQLQESLPQFCLSVPVAIKYYVTSYSLFITIKLLQTCVVKETTCTTTYTHTPRATITLAPGAILQLTYTAVYFHISYNYMHSFDSRKEWGAQDLRLKSLCQLLTAILLIQHSLIYKHSYEPLPNQTPGCTIATWKLQLVSTVQCIKAELCTLTSQLL